jgi:hypothetical protein
MIGISVSFCVQDILRGKVGIEQVEKIIAGTSCRNSAEWNSCIELYRSHYWQDDPEKGEQIFRQLLAEGKIFQPCLKTRKVPLLATDHGIIHWVKAESEIRWCTKL